MQLEDTNTLFDYDVGLNDIVQLMVRPIMTTPTLLPAKPVTNGIGSYSQNGSDQNGTVASSGTESSEEETMEAVSVCGCMSNRVRGGVVY